MKVSVFNLGCKVNQYESDALIKKLIAAGHEVSDKLTYADYYIINTCAVTAEAEKKSRQCIARAKKCNPDAKILICGCASQNNASQFKRDGVQYVSGTAKKDLLAKLDVIGENVVEIPKTYEEVGFARSMRTRSYIKVQDGCNNFCSYCLIPYVRGRSRSRDIDNVVAEIKQVQNSTREIVLTGIDLSSYGIDIGLKLSDLIRAISSFDLRVRLGSFEVNVIDDDLLTALKGLKAFCPHFHLSLQSGSDAVLKTMNRHYTIATYLEKVNLIRKYFPFAAITTDVIVGFPTETDAEFENSLQFIKSVGFADIHCFPYSARKGTAAYKMKVLPREVISAREEKLLALKKEAKDAFIKKNIGVTHKVLFEDAEQGLNVGYTENYIKFYRKHAVRHTVETVVAEKQFADGLM